MPPTVTGRGANLSPFTPDRCGGGPQRIHIEIEIVDRRAQPARPCFGVLQLLLALLLLSLLFGRGHAQPTNWQSYELGSTCYYQGTDAEGGNWNGSSYRLGGTTYFDGYGPNGERRHCESYGSDRRPTPTAGERRTKRPRRRYGGGMAVAATLNAALRMMGWREAMMLKALKPV
jgi:hypothetical protein